MNYFDMIRRRRLPRLLPLWCRPAPPLRPPLGEVARRRPVWAALSELYLDTELRPDDYQGIARALRESAYSVAELEQILFLELHPLLVWNLFSVAGEWAYFDIDWIQWRVTSRWRPAISSVRWLCGRGLVEQEWQAVRRLLIAPDPSLTKPA